jgi:lipoate-protein ligase A
VVEIELAAYESKVSGGKLIKVRVSFDEEIRKVEISGDFFLHPEEAIESLEEALVGIRIPTTEEEVRGRLDTAIDALGTKLIGFSSQDLARSLIEATR